jgi:elongation factor G
MARKIEQLRNIGVIAHIDAGKTTVTERMLFLSGAKHRVGRVDHGTTETDSDAEEQERGITIYAACVTFNWKNAVVNLLDTPGHVDFTAEVERCLRVLDGAVVVFSAREGVEAQSETVWRQADRYRVPRVAFINKMDREGAEFERVFEEIRSRLGAHPVAVQIPVGQGPSHVDNPFRGVIDLIEMRMLSFPAESEGKQVVASDIPADQLDLAQLWRSNMLEQLYEFSDQMAELALQEEPIPADLVRAVLRDATLHQYIQPVFCGSALHGIGVQPLLDAVELYLPSPLDRPPVEGVHPTKFDAKKEPVVERRKPSPKEPFCGLVFKILPAKTGDWYWVRVYSGELKANSRVYSPNQDKKENVAQIWQIHAQKKEANGQIDVISAGDIAGLIGPRHAITGDTLCDAKDPIVLPTIKFAETVISMAIEPESTADRKKLSETLELLKRQDPTFKAAENEETGQTVVSGMGELHLEVIRHRLDRDFNLHVKVHKPRVSYRETVDHGADVVGECHRMIGGQQLFAVLKVHVEPFEKGVQPVTVINRCPPGELPEPLLVAALDELRARGEGGGLICGFPLSKVRVTVLGGQHNEVGSNEQAFKMAANDAFEKGLEAAGKVLLEPVMKVSITAPADYIGGIIDDLQQRRGEIVRNDARGDISTIESHAPLKELFGYSSALRNISQGRATYTMEPLTYKPAPPSVVKEYAI